MHNEKLLNLTRNKFELSFIDFSRVYRWRDIGWVLYSDELGNFSESVEGSCEGKTFFQWSLEDIYLPTWPFFFFRRGRLRWLDGRHFELREGSRVRGFEGSRVRGFEGSRVRGFEGQQQFYPPLSSMEILCQGHFIPHLDYQSAYLHHTMEIFLALFQELGYWPSLEGCW